MITIIEVPLDIPLRHRLNLKINAIISGRLNSTKKVYKPLIDRLKNRFPVKLLGEMNIPPLFHAFPPQEMFPLLSEENMLNFILNNGVKEIANALTTKLLDMDGDTTPFILAFEHAIAYGSAKALKRRYPSMKLLCFDAHIDAIPLHLRGRWATKNQILTSVNFIHTLLEEGTFSPEDVIICGVVEKFKRGSPPDEFLQNLRRMGGRIITKEKFETLLDKPIGKEIYISFDADVCASEKTFAIRTPYLAGIEPERFIETFCKFVQSLKDNKVKICGVDLCEIDPLLVDEDDETLKFWSDTVETLCDAL